MLGSIAAVVSVLGPGPITGGVCMSKVRWSIEQSSIEKSDSGSCCYATFKVFAADGTSTWVVWYTAFFPDLVARPFLVALGDGGGLSVNCSSVNCSLTVSVSLFGGSVKMS